MEKKKGKWKKVLLVALIIIIVIPVLLYFGGRLYIASSTAPYEGEIAVDNLETSVKILFDAKGIPQVYAQNDADMFFALGWLHASERLFQLEMTRRLVEGRLAEVIGERGLDIDIEHRKIGFKGLADEGETWLSDETRTVLQRYSDGINEYVKQASVLPPEFVFLGLDFPEWKPVDCLGALVYQTWYSHLLMSRDNVYNELIEIFGETLADKLRKGYDWTETTIAPVDTGGTIEQEDSQFSMSRASNSWVTAPHRSLNGAALHGSDPHLVVNRFPVIWYIAGLHSEEGINAVGVTVPGIPFVAMGHNSDIAYSFTVSSVDIIDYYIEKKHPNDSLQVLRDYGYTTLITRDEKISVNGNEDPVLLTVKESDIGVIMESYDDHYVTMKWAGFDFKTGEIMNNALDILRAESFEQFRKAVTGLGALDANWIYSDRQGNIGYQLGTPVPIRQFEDVYVRLPAEDTAYYWKGYYPLEEKPYEYNPSRGYIASCNSTIVPEGWSYYLPGNYDPYRIIRAHELLEKEEYHSVSTFMAMQLDSISMLARRWKGLMQQGAEKLNEPELAAEIEQWNCSTGINDTTAALFELWWFSMTKVLFEDQLGADWRRGWYIQRAVLDKPMNDIIDDVLTKDTVETVADISAAALSNALALAEGKTYGEISKLYISNALSEGPLMDELFDLNRGPYPAPGDKGTLNVNYTTYDFDTNEITKIVGPSMRFILDWADIDGFLMTLAIGQSGNSFSDHYDDFVLDMLHGTYWNVPFTEEKVKEKSVSELLLY